MMRRGRIFMDNTDEIMKKADEMEKELIASMTDTQKKIFEDADKFMAEELGVSDYMEFMNLDSKEQKNRLKAMNDKMFEMLNINEKEFKKLDYEMRLNDIKEHKDFAVSDKSVKLLGPLLKNAIYIKISESKAGLSKIGGKPDLPSDFQWYRNENGEALTFLMQINCSDIHKYDKDNIFPETGMLYFFYDLENQAWFSDDNGGKGYAVYYCDKKESELFPVEFPDNDASRFNYYGDTNCTIDEMRIEFFEKPDLPDYEDYMNLCGEPIDNDYDDIKYNLLGYDSEEYNEKYFKLGGYSNCIQYGLTEEFGDEYIQLCQISSFESETSGFMFGDGGNLYFYIKKEDIKSKNFGDVKIILQCY